MAISSPRRPAAPDYSGRAGPHPTPGAGAPRATELLDAAPEPAYDRLTRLAARLLGAPVALVSLVGADRPILTSAFGLPARFAEARAAALSSRLCRHVAATGAPVVVGDVRRHPLACEDALLRDLGAAAYLGVPLTATGGAALGSVCVIDTVARGWTGADEATLMDLAAAVMTEIELRAEIGRRRRAEAALRDVEAGQRGLLEALPVAVYRVAPEPPFAPTYVSPVVEALFGYPHAAWLERADMWIHVLHPDDRDRVLGETAAGLAGGTPVDYEYRVTAADGSTVWVHDRGDFVRDADGRAVAWQGIMLDITARKAAEAALLNREAEYRLLFESNPQPMWVFDRKTLAFLAVNDAAVAQYGYARADFLGMTIRDIRPPEDVPALLAAVGAGEAGRVVHGRPFRHRRKDGSLVDANVVSQTLDFRGRAAVMVLAHDVTAERAAEAALAASERRLQLALAATQDAVWDWDLTTGAADFTARWLDMLGYAPGELPERIETFERLLHPEDASRVAARLQDYLAGRADEYALEVRLRTASGGWRWVLTRGSVAGRDAAGAPVRMVGTHADIHDRKALEAELVRQARHDALTGLANRALFRERVERALSREARLPGAVAVLFLDLDDFKGVNDSLGHAAGDQLLAAAAARLLDATRGSDTVARLGGDEFAVLLENVRDDADATVVADRVTAALRAPFLLDGTEARVGASLGIARARPGDSPDDLLRNADLAMYHAKGLGKGRHETFAAPMHDVAVDRLALAADLRLAIERREPNLAFQPVVALDSGRGVTVEALARWYHPTRGVVSPGEFIPLAEATGSILELGGWVLAEASREAATWGAWAGAAAPAAGEPPAVAVTVSALQLRRAEFVGEIAGALATAGLAPARLVLEVTESMLLDDVEATLARLHALKGLGVRLAVDDFGTGYSSLAYLQRFPVGVLKIDKAFVDRVARGGRDAGLARTMIALGDLLGVCTVAEGIEREDQREALRALGCQVGQGFLFARPLAPAVLRERLSALGGVACPSSAPRPAAAAAGR